MNIVKHLLFLATQRLTDDMGQDVVSLLTLVGRDASIAIHVEMFEFWREGQ